MLILLKDMSHQFTGGDWSIQKHAGTVCYHFTVVFYESLIHNRENFLNGLTLDIIQKNQFDPIYDGEQYYQGSRQRNRPTTQ